MRLLFVCLGNICRSPAAEAILRQQIEEKGLTSRIVVDSAGTANYHSGEEPDSRMRQCLVARSYRQWSRARQVTAEDFHSFDCIVAMDESNIRDLKRICPEPELLNKLRAASSFSARLDCKAVPDPYYGGLAEFEYAIDLLEDIGQELLKQWQTGRLLSGPI